MLDASDSWNKGIASAGEPPNHVVLRATCLAAALARRVYVYRLGSSWLMTSDRSEAPSDVPICTVPANRNERRDAK